MKKKTVY